MVTIIVRSFNDIEYIETTMKMLLEQDYDEFEILNVDSGSRDGTWEVIRKYNADNAYQIKSSDYIPGRVLNEAVARANGDIIVFNNSDCIPQDRNWLKNLIKPLLNAKVAAVFGNQIYRPDAHSLVIKDMVRAFGDGRESKNWHHFFSLATSAVKKSMIQEHPFDPDIQYSEDIEWSYRMKNKGYTLVYVPEAIVEHSHNYTIPQVYKRFHGEGVAEGKIYGFKPSLIRFFLKPFIMEFLRDVIWIAKRNEYHLICQSFIYRLVQKYAVNRGISDYSKGIKR